LWSFLRIASAIARYEGARLALCMPSGTSSGMPSK
jgi:hypothetical protein